MTHEEVIANKLRDAVDDLNTLIEQARSEHDVITYLGISGDRTIEVIRITTTIEI
jgi:hypothetical protein